MIWLDSGYHNSLAEWIRGVKRWIVERAFRWLSKHRRLSKDYESLCETSEAMVYAVMIRLMLAPLDT